MNRLAASVLWKLDLLAGVLKLPFPRPPSLRAEVAFALGRCRKPRYVIDCGANQGEWSRALLSRHAPERLVLIEPGSTLVEHLRAKFQSNSNVTIVQGALSSRVGRAFLFSPKTGSSLGSLVPRESIHDSIQFQQEQEEVELFDIPTLLERTGLPRIDLLKLDVEGHEYEILSAIPAEIRSAIRCIQFEFGGACIDARVYFRDFWKLLAQDFEILRMARTGVIPIRRYREREERFEQVNFLCVNRRTLGHLR